MVEVVIQHQHQDVAMFLDVAPSHIELSMSKWMLPQVKTYPVKHLTLRLVHCDGIAQPEWELSLLDHQSTPGQGEPEYDAREDKPPALQLLHDDQVLADISHNDLGVVHQPILDRDVACHHVQAVEFQFQFVLRHTW